MNNNTLKSKIENNLQQLNIKFTSLNSYQEDEDLTYLIHMKLNGLKEVGHIPFRSPDHRNVYRSASGDDWVRLPDRG